MMRNLLMAALLTVASSALSAEGPAPDMNLHELNYDDDSRHHDDDDLYCFKGKKAEKLFNRLDVEAKVTFHGDKTTATKKTKRVICKLSSTPERDSYRCCYRDIDDHGSNHHDHDCDDDHGPKDHDDDHGPKDEPKDS
jgi:hypothetical protein